MIVSKSMQYVVFYLFVESQYFSIWNVHTMTTASLFMDSFFFSFWSIDINMYVGIESHFPSKVVKCWRKGCVHYHREVLAFIQWMLSFPSFNRIWSSRRPCVCTVTSVKDCRSCVRGCGPSCRCWGYDTICVWQVKENRGHGSRLFPCRVKNMDCVRMEQGRQTRLQKVANRANAGTLVNLKREGGNNGQINSLHSYTLVMYVSYSFTQCFQ